MLCGINSNRYQNIYFTFLLSTVCASHEPEKHKGINIISEQRKDFSAVSKTPKPPALTEFTAKFDNDVEQKLLIWRKKLQNAPKTPKYGKDDGALEKRLLRQGYVDRRRREITNTSTKNIRCAYCVSPDSGANSCLNGVGLPTKECREGEVCFLEAHTNRVERGCILPSAVNRTFACKCSLCNDKSLNETPYYESLSDWRYDNKLLQKTFFFEDVTLCKDCVTRGKDETVDEICREGTNAPSIICDPEQICATTITGMEDHTYVWRGCIDKPIYNTFWLFCNDSTCSPTEFDSEKKNPSHYELLSAPDTSSDATRIYKSHGFSMPLVFLYLFTYLTKYRAFE